jgi:hypothetical protein
MKFHRWALVPYKDGWQMHAYKSENTRSKCKKHAFPETLPKKVGKQWEYCRRCLEKVKKSYERRSRRRIEEELVV